jgi:hypothetical protein
LLERHGGFLASDPRLIELKKVIPVREPQPFDLETLRLIVVPLISTGAKVSFVKRTKDTEEISSENNGQ